MVFAVLRLQHHVARRQLAVGFYVFVDLIVQAALQLGAHAGQLLRVERDVLNACGIGRNAGEVFHPRGAAQLAAAGPRAANAPRLLACADLLHLDAHVERVGQHLDELAKVHPLVGNIVEDGLVAVALILHIAYFHLQSQVFGDLPALYHRAVFTAFGLFVFLHIHGLGHAVDAANFVGRLQVGFLDLQPYQPPREGHHADVVSRIRLHGHHVALFQVEVVHIVIVSLACILELHLHQIGRVCVAGHVGQPVVGVELPVLPAHAGMAEPPAAARAYLSVSHIIVLNI